MLGPGDPQWDGHLLLLHGSESERRAILTAWVRRGIERGEKVIYSEGSVAPQDSLFAGLDAHDIDTDAAGRDGRLEVLPLAEFYPPAGPDQVVLRALAEGFAAVRMSAEANAALTLLSPDSYLAIERNMDRLCRSRPVSAMCQYPKSGISGSRLFDTVQVHATGVRQVRLATDQDGNGLLLRGEIDATNVDVFAAVVATATRQAAQTVSLDLTGLTYTVPGMHLLGGNA